MEILRRLVAIYFFMVEIAIVGKNRQENWMLANPTKNHQKNYTYNVLMLVLQQYMLAEAFIYL